MRYTLHIWMWKLDCEESWAPKNWCFGTVMLEKTLESPLDCKEVQRSILKEISLQRDFFGRNDAKTETPILWPPHAKSWLIGKDSDAERDWGQEEKGTTEDEMAGWHHRLDGRESEWTPGLGDGQGGLACCNSWGRKESDTTERLNWTELNFTYNVVYRWLWRIINELSLFMNNCQYWATRTFLLYLSFTSVRIKWQFLLKKKQKQKTKISMKKLFCEASFSVWCVLKAVCSKNLAVILQQVHLSPLPPTPTWHQLLVPSELPGGGALEGHRLTPRV